MKTLKLSIIVVAAALIALTGSGLAVCVDQIPGPLTGHLTNTTSTMKFKSMGDSSRISYAFEPTSSGYAHTGSTPAGQLKYLQDGQNTIAWCVDVYQDVSSGNKQYTMADITDTDYLATVNKLYTMYNSALAGGTNADVAATAFQLAMWEVTFETSGQYSLTDGWFTADGSSSVDTLAGDWLALDITDYSEYEMSYWVNDKYQDLVTFGDEIGPGPPSVPEPLTAFCVAVSAAGLGGYIRKRIKDK